MLTTNLETLKIHKLTKAQYERELAAGNIDANALYLTPEEEIDPRYMTKENPTGTGTLSLNGNSGTNIGGYAVELGYNTSSTGNYSFAAGYNTVASGSYNHVIGKYNVEDEMSNYISIVGNGDETTPSNAYTLDWDGNAWFAGDVTTAAGTSLNNHSHAWSTITDKPSTFAPSSHSHAWSEITGKPSTFTPASHSHDYLPLSGGTLTGAFTSNKGIHIGGSDESSYPYIYNSGKVLYIRCGNTYWAFGETGITKNGTIKVQ